MGDGPNYRGEAMLFSWSDSSAGRKVTFLLPDEGEEHPFKGFKTGPAHGTAFAIMTMPVDHDNPEPEPQEGDQVKSVAGYAKPPMSESQKCALMCNDQQFKAWLKAGWPSWDGDPASLVRNLLNVASRSEIDSDPTVREEWLALVKEYGTTVPQH